ncbi:hypothetical protein FQA47_010254 [Oryzias melastigma]|uniref:Uncharacterized protein n=1 Tax=Oryzias melastigma TaxID=30732 RepID=A0A834FJ33_ORYME|nr:hypothetical protein FQA47_010254 [Oryzias melastigma]
MMLRPGLLPPVFQHHHPAVTISYQAENLNLLAAECAGKEEWKQQQMPPNIPPLTLPQLVDMHLCAVKRCVTVSGGRSMAAVWNIHGGEGEESERRRRVQWKKEGWRESLL